MGPIVAAALAAGASGCLVLSPPEYEEPAQTAPFLMAPSPTTTRAVYIDPNTIDMQFGASVVSEDRGEPVVTALYLDYGVPNAAQTPFLRNLYSQSNVEAGKISDGPRPFLFQWFIQRMPIPADGYCHTVTLVASHAFNPCGCPVDADDMSSLTWQIIHCNPNDPDCPTACPPVDCGAARCPSCTYMDPDPHDCASH